MKNIIFKMIIVFFLGTFLLGCGSYKKRFGGHKKDEHLNAEEQQALVLPSDLENKKSTCGCSKGSQNNIPKISSKSNDLKESVSTLPPNF